MFKSSRKTFFLKKCHLVSGTFIAALGPAPAHITCPHCRYVVVTSTETEPNCAAHLCCLFLLVIGYVFIYDTCIFNNGGGNRSRFIIRRWKWFSYRVYVFEEYVAINWNYSLRIEIIRLNFGGVSESNYASTEMRHQFFRIIANETGVWCVSNTEIMKLD